MPKLGKQEMKAMKKAKRMQKALEKEAAARTRQMEALDREEDTSNRNIKKINKMFRDFILQEQQVISRDQVKEVFQRFNTAVDYKDFTINAKQDEIRQANDQSMRFCRSNCEEVNKALELLRNQIDEIQRDYQEHLDKLKGANTKQMEALTSLAEVQQQDLMRILYQMNINNEKDAAFRNELLVNKHAVETSKFEDQVEVTRLLGEKELQKYWNLYKQELDAYNQRNSERDRDFDNMKNAFIKSSDKVTSNVSRMAHLQEKILCLKNVYRNILKEYGRKLGDLREEKKLFSDSYWMLRKKLQDEKDLDEKMIALQGKDGTSTIEILKIKVKKYYGPLNYVGNWKLKMKKFYRFFTINLTNRVQVHPTRKFHLKLHRFLKSWCRNFATFGITLPKRMPIVWNWTKNDVNFYMTRKKSTAK